MSVLENIAVSNIYKGKFVKRLQLDFNDDFHCVTEFTKDMNYKEIIFKLQNLSHIITEHYDNLKRKL